MSPSARKQVVNAAADGRSHSR